MGTHGGMLQFLLGPSTEPKILERRVISTGARAKPRRGGKPRRVWACVDRQKSKQLRRKAQVSSGAYPASSCKLFTGLPIPIEMKWVASPRLPAMAATSLCEKQEVGTFVNSGALSTLNIYLGVQVRALDGKRSLLW